MRYFFIFFFVVGPSELPNKQFDETYVFQLYCWQTESENELP